MTSSIALAARALHGRHPGRTRGGEPCQMCVDDAREVIAALGGRSADLVARAWDEGLAAYDPTWTPPNPYRAERVEEET